MSVTTRAGRTYDLTPPTVADRRRQRAGMSTDQLAIVRGELKPPGIEQLERGWLTNAELQNARTRAARARMSDERRAVECSENTEEDSSSEDIWCSKARHHWTRLPIHRIPNPAPITLGPPSVCGSCRKFQMPSYMTTLISYHLYTNNNSAELLQQFLLLWWQNRRRPYRYHWLDWNVHG